MNLTNNYYWIQNAVSPDVCQRIIDQGLSQIKKEESLGLDTSAKTSGNLSKQDLPSAIPRNDKTLQDLHSSEETAYVRDSNVTWLRDQWIYDELLPHINKANVKANWNWDIDYCEDLQFTVYKNNQFYGWHADGGSDWGAIYRRKVQGVTPNDNKKYVDVEQLVGKVRKISMTLNLSRPEDYEGGELKFDFGPHSEVDRYKICEEIKPQGSMIVFPSFLHHCVAPVTSGTRYSLVLWAVGDPFK